MPQLIMTKGSPSIDGSDKRAVYTFFEKLAKDDTTPGLHIEPINGSLDTRVRTGRVTRFLRAVLVRLQGGDDATYVYIGTYGHDQAIDYAKRIRLTMNPVNGVPELEEMVAPKANATGDGVPFARTASAEADQGNGPGPAGGSGASAQAPQTPQGASGDAESASAEAPSQKANLYESDPERNSAPEAAAATAGAATPSSVTGGSQPHYPILGTYGHTMEGLTDLGIRQDLARQAMELRTEDALLEFADGLRPAWQSDLLVSLACGESVTDAMAALGLGESAADEDEALDTSEEPQAAVRATTEDEELLAAMRKPAAQLDFAIVDDTDEGMAEFFAVLDGGSFNQWRVFLHPQQRAYAMRSRNGAFRLSGGAGTGKTVVLVHRARELHRKNPQARIVLTTYNKTLAQALESNLELLDSTVPQVAYGEPGVTVASVDALVRRTLVAAGDELATPGPSGRSAVASVLGERTSSVLGITGQGAWQEAIDAQNDLPDFVTPAFMRAEYSLVVLSNRITTEAEYAKVRRPGRGVRMGRASRRAVWKVIASYRALAAADGSTDWHEKAMIAAAYLNDRVARGVQRPADHVLVDEAQDLTPAHLKFLRALVPEGKNDLFLAEDAHQRIYGPKVVLSHHGINIRGRSRRLTLNYRTTAQNLHYAVGVLEGADFSDLSGQEVSLAGYRSARAGVAPVLRGFDDMAAEADGVGQAVREWVDQGAPGETIGLLCASKHRGERWVRELAEYGVKATFVGPDKNPPAPGGEVSVSVMTLHRAKGMEFNKVILTGMNDSDAFGSGSAARADDQEDEALRQRSLIYVAATRARDELMVTWAGRAHGLVGA